MTEITKIAIFKGGKIRKTIYLNEWWFVIEDIVTALTDTSNPKDYINKMKLRDAELSKGYGQIVHTLSVDTAGGRQKMNCANTEGIFRIIQSIPSSKAEPFKRWLAKVNYEIFLSFPRKRESRNYIYRFPIWSGMTHWLYAQNLLRIYSFK